MTYDVQAGEHAAKLTFDDDSFTYARHGGASISKTFSIAQAAAATYSVVIEGRGYRVTESGAGEMVVNGRALRVEVHDPRKLRGKASADRSGGRRTIAAPMPGRVIRVLVETGQEVEAGEGLIVVEAMKMQNEMKSPKAGRVLEVHTQAGAAVAAGEALLVID